jgi:DNA-binding winged helix-turn-helix (wHTH) protein/TolB-like protein/Flp pilus assembly protein TadD
MDAKPLIYQFDDVSVDLERFEVLKGVTRVRLEPKAFEALVFLIEHRGRLVEKKELLDAVWTDAFVTENAMTRVIAQLRKALGEDSKQAKYIETVPTRGYRFIAEVEVADDKGRPLSEPGRAIVELPSDLREARQEQQQNGITARQLLYWISFPPTAAAAVLSGIRRHKIAFGALALLALIGMGFYLFAGRGGGKAIDSVAVLPFVNVSADPNTEYLSEGISDSIVNSLSQLPKLRVMPWSRVSRYKGRVVDPLEAGRELGVGAVLVGKVTVRGDSLNIRMELVDVGQVSQLWNGQYNPKLSDILTTQEEIAKQITENLRLKLTGEEQKQMTKRYTENTEAYQLYLKGHYHLNRRGAENVKKAIAHFEQAIAKDPSFALAYAELASSYGSLGDPTIGLLSPREAFLKGKGPLLRALELDPSLAEAHNSLAWLNLLYERDWLGAEREFKRAIDLNPNLIKARLDYGLYLSMSGRYDDAIDQVNRALEIDPIDLRANQFLGERFWNAGRYDEAIKQLQKTLDLDPKWPGAHVNLGWVYEEKGMYEEAIAEYSQVRSLTEDSPEVFSYFGRAYAGAGKREEAQKMIAELKKQSERRYISAYLIAWVYARLGEKEQTIAYLEKAYEDGDLWLTWIKVDPVLDGVRSDPRFTKLVRRIGLR